MIFVIGVGLQIMLQYTGLLAAGHVGDSSHYPQCRCSADHHEAVEYCEDCKEGLCLAMATSHRRMKGSARHKIISILEKRPSSPSAASSTTEIPSDAGARLEMA